MSISSSPYAEMMFFLPCFSDIILLTGPGRISLCMTIWLALATFCLVLCSLQLSVGLNFSVVVFVCFLLHVLLMAVCNLLPCGVYVCVCLNSACECWAHRKNDLWRCRTMTKRKTKTSAGKILLVEIGISYNWFTKYEAHKKGHKDFISNESVRPSVWPSSYAPHWSLPPPMYILQIFF